MRVIGQSAINELITPPDMVSTVRKAFHIYGKSKYVMPERFGFEHDGVTLLYMPCFTEDICGTKMLTLVPENRTRNLPAIDGAVLLNDRTTGTVRALLDGKSITAWRTGATGALAVSELAPADAQNLGIVGCGVQGFFQGRCICTVRDIRRIYLFDKFKSVDALAVYAKDLKKVCPSVEEVILCSSAEQMLSGSDIVVTTTFSTEPVLPEDEKLLRGKTYIAVGSYKPYMKELPDTLFSIADAVYADIPYACEESGDLSARLESGLLRRENVHLLHEILDGQMRKPQYGTTVFKTVGMALVDIVTAEYIYMTALQKGVGTEVEL